ncbi:MAG: DUF126 domain-containing protein [Actinomycetota bacterium]|jgi:hypothetical protein|nr:DUF126 domain-containing protein [Actinomycetota bacterium]
MRAQATVLNPGSVEAEAIVLDEELSFWGGFDPATGTILDISHPQRGASLSGKVVVMPASRGSAGTPGALGESLRIGTGPAGIVLLERDINIAVGAMVVASLYDSHCPVVVVNEGDYNTIDAGDQVIISADGVISTTS